MRLQAILFLVFLALSRTHGERAKIRGKSSRQLWNPFSSLPTIQSIIAAFVPTLSSSILRTLVLLPSTGTKGSLELGDTNFGLCTASALLNFSFGILRGLETFRIETFELVPGTDSFDTHLFGWNGADWNGTFVFRAGFHELASTMTGGLFAKGCSYSVNDTFGGSLVADNPTMELEFEIAGTTPNLFRLGSSSAKSIDVRSVAMPYNSLALNLVGFNSTEVTFDIGQILDQFSTNLNENVIPLIKDTLQYDLGDGLPFELSE